MSAAARINEQDGASLGNCSLRCSTSCIHAVVCQEGLMV